MLKKFILNARKPAGRGGSVMLRLMNFGHARLAKWGLDYLNIKSNDYILDVGCGGGANIKTLLQKTKGNVYGLDYSTLCVEKSKAINEEAIIGKRCEIKEGSVSEIPYGNSMFDIVTAFETVYFWLDFENCLQEILRVLKSEGTFFICNEVVREEGKEPPFKYFDTMLGAKIYSPNDYRNILSNAGFTDIRVNLSKNKKRICITAQKP
jgi:ubiquinone/menaquinone biosynthesis C-methylase UbiE